MSHRGIRFQCHPWYQFRGCPFSFHLQFLALNRLLVLMFNSIRKLVRGHSRSFSSKDFFGNYSNLQKILSWMCSCSHIILYPVTYIHAKIKGSDFDGSVCVRSCLQPPNLGTCNLFSSFCSLRLSYFTGTCHIWRECSNSHGGSR